MQVNKKFPTFFSLSFQKVGGNGRGGEGGSSQFLQSPKNQKRALDFIKISYIVPYSS